MKKEPLKNELRTLCSFIRAHLALRDAKKEADRKAAGVVTNEEQRAWRAAQRASEGGVQ